MRLKGLRQVRETETRLAHNQKKLGSTPRPATNDYAMTYLVIIGILSLAGILLILWYSIKRLESYTERLDKDLERFGKILEWKLSEEALEPAEQVFKQKKFVTNKKGIFTFDRIISDRENKQGQETIIKRKMGINY